MADFLAREAEPRRTGTPTGPGRRKGETGDIPQPDAGEIEDRENAKWDAVADRLVQQQRAQEAKGMSSIEESIGQLDEAKAKLDEAWDTAAGAKEQAAEAGDMIRAVSTESQTLNQANDMIQEAKHQIEQGQALIDSARDQIEEYKSTLGS